MITVVDWSDNAFNTMDRGPRRGKRSPLELSPSLVGSENESMTGSFITTDTTQGSFSENSSLSLSSSSEKEEKDEKQRRGKKAKGHKREREDDIYDEEKEYQSRQTRGKRVKAFQTNMRKEPKRAGAKRSVTISE